MDDKFKKTMDSIQLDDGAKERMLKHIREKAASEEPVKQPFYTKRWVMTVGMAVAACLVIIAAFAVGRLTKKNKSDDIAVTTTGDVIVGPDSTQGESTYDLITGPELWKEKLGINVTFPEDVYSASCGIYGGYKVECIFGYSGYEYSLYVVKGDTIPKEIIPGDEVTLEFHSELNGAIYLYEENGTPTGQGQVCFTKNDQSYCIVCMAGADEEYMRTVGEAFVEAN